MVRGGERGRKCTVGGGYSESYWWKGHAAPPLQRKRLNPRETALLPRPINRVTSPLVPPIPGFRLAPRTRFPPELGTDVCVPPLQPSRPGLGRRVQDRVWGSGGVNSGHLLGLHWPRTDSTRNKAPAPLFPGRKWLEKDQGPRRGWGICPAAQGPRALARACPPPPVGPHWSQCGWATDWPTIQNL